MVYSHTGKGVDDEDVGNHSGEKDEAGSLRRFLPRLRGTIADLQRSADITVVDDGSTDDTSRIAEEHGCIVQRNPENRGLGYSLRRGYQYAVDHGYDTAAIMDADGQHDERCLPTVLDALGGADVVIASRYHPESARDGVPLDRDLLNVATTAMIRAVTGWQTTDPLSGFWGIRRRVLEFLARHARLERYGTVLENLIKLWHLCTPRPTLVEVPHPAIYQDPGRVFTVKYSPDNRENRVDRFGTHALHILEALDDVRAANGNGGPASMVQAWRTRQLEVPTPASAGQ